MQDAIAFEQKLRPTAVIITEEFVHEADVQKSALGMKSLVPVVIDHPLSTLTENEIDARTEQAVAQIEEILAGHQ